MANALNRYCSPLRPFLTFLFITLCTLTLSRLSLIIWQHERVDSFKDWLTILGFGLRIDLASLAYLAALPALFAVLVSGIPYINRVWDIACRIWLSAAFVFCVFMEASTPAFINEYNLRPNRLFVEYLIYPKEVFSMLMAGHKLTLALSLLVTIAAFVGIYYLMRKQHITNKPQPKWFERPILAVLILLIGVLAARSSLQHRAINPSYTAFTNDPLVNSLTLNSAYSMLHAVSQMQDEVSSFQLYPQMSKADIISNIHKSMGLKEADFVSKDFPTLHKQTATHQYKHPKNLVIILQESQGAQFIGSLGGLPLSPEYDKLAKEGWAFNQLYATGTRSVRGIEAVVTGFVPTPARSTVKLPNSQTGFFTLAKLLGQKGYDTSFIYGGGAHFDNMKAFFLGNGFNSIIEEKDFVNPEFVASWGVSDEDLFKKANATFIEKAKHNKPFFSLVFSSSNHDPFDFPDGKIEDYNTPKNSRENAVKYADYAVGKFFDMAKASNYWKNTVFLIVADHDARSSRPELVPITNFHIPGLILGADVSPQEDHRLISQIDLAPTLLSLIGINSSHPMIGQDLTKRDASYVGRAIMQFNQNQAFMRGNQVVILQPKLPPKTFIYRNHRLEASKDVSPELISEAIAHPLLGTWLYEDKKYNIPRESEE
ncbi:Lipoteichoic acid synthase 2 [Marinomonas spartinae]|uniref:Lipoteichoic acid synthase 2 n=1 Tax=Marinomonas spartinae TaxID=1792290 RepID=A0A1A8TG56_9GAMM|nr:LTA synthase family protein [Marinomonas spartinae]SBS32083.1 Lipoteichoic acid synthase 2 [Marinomonas spartinae]